MTDAQKSAVMDILSSVFAALTVFGVTQVSTSTEEWITGVIGTVITLFTMISGHFVRKLS